MNLKTFNSEYNVVEFHHYINHIDDRSINVNVVELLLECPVDEFNENDLESIFIIEEDSKTHIFSWYKVDEYYEENGYLKVILMK
jgi:hypothetical protein